MTCPVLWSKVYRLQQETFSSWRGLQISGDTIKKRACVCVCLFQCRATKPVLFFYYWRRCHWGSLTPVWLPDELHTTHDASYSCLGIIPYIKPTLHHITLPDGCWKPSGGSHLFFQRSPSLCSPSPLPQSSVTVLSSSSSAHLSDVPIMSLQFLPSLLHPHISAASFILITLFITQPSCQTNSVETSAQSFIQSSLGEEIGLRRKKKLVWACKF